MFKLKGKSKKEIQYLIDKSERRNEIHFHPDHKYVTRRDLLGSGFIGFSGWMMAPSILSLVMRPEFAAAQDLSCGGEEGGASGPQWPAFVAVNLAGGASLAGNYIPRGADRNFIASYAKMGLGTNSVQTEANRTSEFGVDSFSSISGTNGIIAGIRAVNTAAATKFLDKTAFLAVCVPSGDDNSNNTMDPSGMIMKAGLAGSVLPNMGTTATQGTGIGMRPAKQIAPPAPLQATNIASIQAALAPAAALGALSVSQRKSVFELVNSLSGSQSRRLAAENSSASAQTVGKLVECATGKNINLAASSGPVVDPRLAPAVGGENVVQTIWQLGNTGAINGRSQNDRIAMSAMVYNSLKGQSANVGLNIGGYDYHGNARANTNAQDLNAGTLIGWTLASAAAMGKKVMIHVTSDGSVDSSGTTFGSDYSSDQGSHGTNYIIMYDPAGRPAVDPVRGWQIGHFTAGGNADSTTMVGTPDNAAVATFVNYLKFAGKLDLATRVLAVTAAELDYMVRIA